jgi:hypothetical protein
MKRSTSSALTLKVNVRDALPPSFTEPKSAVAGARVRVAEAVPGASSKTNAVTAATMVLRVI